MVCRHPLDCNVCAGFVVADVGMGREGVVDVVVAVVVGVVGDVEVEENAVVLVVAELEHRVRLEGPNEAPKLWLKHLNGLQASRLVAGSKFELQSAYPQEGFVVQKSPTWLPPGCDPACHHRQLMFS